MISKYCVPVKRYRSGESGFQKRPDGRDEGGLSIRSTYPKESAVAKFDKYGE